MSVFDPVDGFLESFRYQYMVRGFIWTGIMTDRGHILKPSMSREDFRPMLRIYDSTMTQIDSIFSAEEDEGGRAGRALRRPREDCAGGVKSGLAPRLCACAVPT